MRRWLLLLALLPFPAAAAVTLDYSSGELELQNIDAPVATWSHTVSGANPVLIVRIGYPETIEYGGSISSVTFNGVGLMYVGSSIESGGGTHGDKVYFWKMDAPPTGTHDLSVTWSWDGVSHVTANSISFNGASQSDPAPNFQAGDGITTSGGHLSTTITGVASGSYLLDAAICWNAGGIWTADSPQNDEGASTSRWRYSYHASPSSSQAMGWTTKATWEYAHAILEVKAAASAPSTGRPCLRGVKLRGVKVR